MKTISLMLLAAATTVAAYSQHPIPAITCEPGPGEQACTSLKELVDARDSGILLALTGNPDQAGRHVAYACFSSDTDSFYIIEYSAREANDFGPSFTPPDSKLRRRFFAGPLSDIGQVPTTMIDRWFAAHSKGMLYADGAINLFNYQNGFLVDMNSAFGEWARPKNSPTDISPSAIEYAQFTGNIYWLNHIASSRPVLSLTAEILTAESFTNAAELYVHYRFKNQAKGVADDTLEIQRSTGRFAETVKTPGHEYDDHGTCKIFKY